MVLARLAFFWIVSFNLFAAQAEADFVCGVLN
jgi:hypothetical protein